MASQIEVTLGEHDVETEEEASHVVDPVAEIIPHPQYDSNTIINDFALIKLATCVDDLDLAGGADHIVPACLPDSDFAVVDGDKVTQLLAMCNVAA